MNKEFKMIRDLMGAEITDRKKDEAAARALLKKYFASDPDKMWDLMTPTYQDKVDRIAYIEGCTDYLKEHNPKIKIKGLRVYSGCMVEASVELKVTIKRLRKVGDRTIAMIRESGPYSPDPKSPLRINGTTVPPYIAR